MDYEKKYKEALAWMKDVYPTLEGAAKEDAEHHFPELKESIDERVKKVIRQVLNESTTEKDECYSGNGVTQQEVFAWLEKGEQEPAVIIPKFRVGDVIRIKGSNAEYLITEISDGYYRGKGWCLDIIEADKCGDYELVEQNHAWSEEDEYVINKVLNWAILVDPTSSIFETLPKERFIEILKHLKDRVQPHSKQEWREEDERMYKAISIALSCNDAKGYLSSWYTTPEEADHWLNSFKERVQPQNTWKPSDEQMRELGIVATGKGWFSKEILSELLEQLKKLKEE